MNPEDLDSLAEYATPVVAGEDTIVAITRPDLRASLMFMANTLSGGGWMG